MWGLMVVAGLVFNVWLMVTGVLKFGERRPSLFGLSDRSLFCLYGLTFAVSAIVVFVAVARAMAMSKWPTVYERTCLLCGYEWLWEPGEPQPKVHVRPDLIQLGAQRLAKEEDDL